MQSIQWAKGTTEDALKPVLHSMRHSPVSKPAVFPAPGTLVKRGTKSQRALGSVALAYLCKAMEMGDEWLPLDIPETIKPLWRGAEEQTSYPAKQFWPLTSINHKQPPASSSFSAWDHLQFGNGKRVPYAAHTPSSRA